MYSTINFKSKKALKDAVQAWNEFTASGDANWCKPIPKPVTYFQPGPFGGNEPKDGTFCVEGPQYPQAHRWYAECIAENGVIVKVKK